MKVKYGKELMDSGYTRAHPLPSQEELDQFYQDLYYGENVTSTYQVEYSPDEILQKKLRADCTIELLSQNNQGASELSLLEVGCGEGFLLASSIAKKWKTTGVDYQIKPIQKFNPSVVSNVVEMEPNKYLDQLVSDGTKKDIIVLQNVLEHVLDPETLLTKLAGLMSDTGCLLVQVPNDFSDLQGLAQEQNLLTGEYWFSPPQHLNYFNENNIYNVVESCGLEIVDGIGDFPIEIYLWGGAENYAKNKQLGKYAHNARVSLDLFIARKGLEQYLNFYRGAFDVGLGRNLCVVLRPIGR